MPNNVLHISNSPANALPWLKDLIEFFLTILSLQIKLNNCANSADPDETARDEPSHQDLHCLPYYYDV